MSKKYVYMFAEGNASMRELLGGKGANLAEMASLGLPVPYGFTITTEACNAYYDDGEHINKDIMSQVKTALGKLEKQAGKKLGDSKNPLLVSVRSGARASMPGMMDTILNLGINDEVAATIASKTNNERFAYDSYRRFIQMFSDVVMELSKKRFEEIIDELKAKKGVKLDTELDADDMKELVKRFKAFYKKELKEDFPQDTKVQLERAIEAVFKSWNNPRAIFYRKENDIPSSWGTAVNVQMMVFGNMGDDCGTGVAFTRNPATGENKIFGEFLMNAQGEDVVAGVRTPQTIDQLQKVMPACYKQFEKICKTLEKHYHDMQDMEFTIEEKKLFMLQTRNGKRTATAALKVACDMVDEKLVTVDQALMMVEPKQLDALLHPQFDSAALKAAKPIAKGLPASPGAACGQIVFSAEDAAREHKNGKKVVLVRLETSPEDIEGMAAAEGVLTVRGGMTSHAAVVARGMGECCVSGCGDIKIDYAKKQFTVNGKTYKEFDWLSLDGSTGNIYGEAINTVPASISGNFKRFMKWADDRRRLQIRTNADTPKDAAQALAFGAQGIGLVRTEHMFFQEDKIKAIREMIVSTTTEQRKAALEKVLPLQEKDFEGIYEAMQGNPVTIRYLDPPLHEFVPTGEKEIKDAKVKLSYHVGTMIEIPRAALLADEIATEAEFFSFGTNDLTQMTFGFSRDDAGKFLGSYYDAKIYEQDPFARLDTHGVGKLIQNAVTLGRSVRPDIKLGICGEHGGDPSSIEFCDKIGLTYVSCSPYRVPIARLAAAQAAIKNGAKPASKTTKKTSKTTKATKTSKKK